MKSTRKIIGAVMMILGVLGEFYAVTTYAEDVSRSYYGYTYTAPYTTHELVVISIAAVSLICFIVGLILLLIRTKKVSK